MGVSLAGRSGVYLDFFRLLDPSRDAILAELPPGAKYQKFYTGNDYTYIVNRHANEFAKDQERTAWIAETVNAFANVAGHG